MSLIKANPAAEVSVGFETIRPGTYRMRIKAVENRNPAKNDLKLTLEYVDTSALIGLTGEPLKGNAGNLFDYIMLADDKQWKLRQVVEACGMTWQDLDEQDLVGKECDVTVKLETYEGEQRNKVARYVVVKS